MIKAVCVGRTTYDINLSVPTSPEEGTTNEFFDTTGKVGGSAATVALCLSKWGVRTSIATILGNDVNGNRIKKEFEKYKEQYKSFLNRIDNLSIREEAGRKLIKDLTGREKGGGKNVHCYANFSAGTLHCGH